MQRIESNERDVRVVLINTENFQRFSAKKLRLQALSKCDLFDNISLCSHQTHNNSFSLFTYLGDTSRTVSGTRFRSRCSVKHETIKVTQQQKYVLGLLRMRASGKQSSSCQLVSDDFMRFCNCCSFEELQELIVLKVLLTTTLR
jgi:hypothetical protein